MTTPEPIKDAYRTMVKMIDSGRLSDEEFAALSFIAGYMAADSDDLEHIWDNRHDA